MDREHPETQRDNFRQDYPSLPAQTQLPINAVDNSFASSEPSFTPTRNLREGQSFATTNGFGSSDSETTRGQFFYDYSSSTDSIKLLNPSPSRPNRRVLQGNNTPRRDPPLMEEPNAPSPARAEQQHAPTTETSKNNAKRRKRRSSTRFVRTENTDNETHDNDSDPESADDLAGAAANTGTDLLQMTPIPHTSFLKKTSRPVVIKQEEVEEDIPATATNEPSNEAPEPGLESNEAPEPVTESNETPQESENAVQTPSRRRSARRSLGGSYSQKTVLKASKNLTLSDLESSEDDLEPPDMTFQLDPGEGVSVRVKPDGTVSGIDGESFAADGVPNDDDLDTPPELQTFRLGDDRPSRSNRLLRMEESENMLADLDKPTAQTPERRARSQSVTRSVGRSRRQSSVLRERSRRSQELQDLSQFTAEEIEKSILSGPRRVRRDEPTTQEEEQQFYNEDPPPNGRAFFPELNSEIESEEEQVPNGVVENQEPYTNGQHYEEEELNDDAAFIEDDDQEQYEDPYNYPNEVSQHHDDSREIYQLRDDMNITEQSRHFYDQEAEANEEALENEMEEHFLRQEAEAEAQNRYQGSRTTATPEVEPVLEYDERAYDEQAHDEAVFNDLPPPRPPPPQHAPSAASRLSRPSRTQERLYPDLDFSPPAPSGHRARTFSPALSPPPATSGGQDVSPSRVREPGTAILKRKAHDTSFADDWRSNTTTDGSGRADVTFNLEHKHSRPRQQARARPRTKRRRLDLDWGAEHWQRLHVCLRSGSAADDLAEEQEQDQEQDQGLGGLPYVPLRVRKELPEFSKLELARRMLALRRIQAMKQQQQER